MSIITINPGSGPVEQTSAQNAESNIKHFITDCGVEGVKYVRIPEEDYGEGRYAFILWKGETCHEIQMPGCALERVRYMEEEGQNIWDYPRLYVDGSSWVWRFAILGHESFENDPNSL